MTDLSEYHIGTTSIISIRENKLHESDANLSIINKFWWANPHILEKLEKYLDTRKINNKIVDVGCGWAPFQRSTHILDFSSRPFSDKILIQLDLDFDTFQYDNNYFNFVYSRHTLEDIMNPLHAFQELIRISPRGFIETPSPLIEISKGVDGSQINNIPYHGYRHHRYIIWSDFETNTLHFLPKYPIIEHISIEQNDQKLMNYLANNYPIYWNNYYFWDENHPPKAVLYRHGINMDMDKDYFSILQSAINRSMEYSDNIISCIT